MALNRALMSGASAFALASAALLVSTQASAATVIVATAPADVSTAVSDANAGQVVDLQVATGVTIDLTGLSLTYNTAGGSLNIGGSSTAGFNGTLENGTITFTQPLTVTTGVSGTINTALAGSGALQVGGNIGLDQQGVFFVTPTLTLSGANSYSGGTNLSGSGAVQVIFANAGAVPTTGQFGGGFEAVGAGFAINQAFITNFAVAQNSVAALDADSSNPLNFSVLAANGVTLGAVDGTWTYSGALTPTSGGFYFVGGGNGTLIISSNLTSASGKVVQGDTDNYTTGFTILTGTNTYTQGSVIIGGILEFGNAGALPSTGAVDLRNTGTVAFGYALDQTTLNRVVNQGTYDTVALAANDSNNLDFSGQTGVSLGAVGNFTYSGTLTPVAGTGSGLGYLLGGGEGALTVSSVLSGANDLTINQGWSFNSTQHQGRGDGGPVPSVILTNTETYTGATTIDYGLLQLGNGTTNGMISGSGVTTNIFYENSSILAFDEATPVTMTVPIGGATAVEQDGPGTVTLNGAETYTGITYIKAGTLALGPSAVFSGFGFNPIYVASGATLDTSGGGNQNIPGLAGVAGAMVTIGSTTLTLNDGTTYSLSLYNGQQPIPGASALVGGNDFGGVISGTGNIVIKGGGGTGAGETFSGINTYQGTTTLDSGLTLGDGVNVGQAGTGAIIGAGGLDFDEPSHTTIANNIGGSVGVQQIGVGEVTLTGDNTYSGATYVGNFGTSATLDLGNGATLGNGAGGVFVSGVLIFDEGGTTVTIGNVISDLNGSQSGRVNINGGTVTFDAADTYTGETSVAGGELVLGDSSHTGAGVAGDVSIGADGTLGGYGTVGGDVTNDGTVQANSLHISGTYTQGANANLEVGVTPTGIEVLTVTGTATLGGNVIFAYAPGTYTAQTYTFVRSGGLGASTFANVSASNADPAPSGFSQSVSYTTDDANLVLAGVTPPPTPTPPPPTPTPPPPTPTPPPPTPTPPPPTPTPPPPTPTPPPPTPTPPPPTPTPPPPTPTPPTPTPPPPTPTPTPVVVAPADSAIFSAQVFAFTQSNQDAVSELLGRSKPNGDGNSFFNLIPVSGDPARAWAEVDAGTTTANANSSGPGFHTDTSGLQGGGDMDVGAGNRLGLALGYDRDTLHDKDTGSASGDTFRASLYASEPLGALGLSEVISYAKAWNSTNRATGAGMAQASFTSEDLTGAIQIAAPFEAGGIAVTPAAGAQFSHVTSSAFSETDLVSAAFAVKGVGQSVNFASPYVSVGVSQSFLSGGGMSITPDAQVGYRYDQAALGQRFTLTANSTVFTGNRVGLEGGSAFFGLSLTAHQGQWSAYAKYRAQVASGWSDQSGALGFRLAF